MPNAVIRAIRKVRVPAASTNEPIRAATTAKTETRTFHPRRQANTMVAQSSTANCNSSLAYDSLIDWDAPLTENWAEQVDDVV
jgi:hypothetical protein